MTHSHHNPEQIDVYAPKNRPLKVLLVAPSLDTIGGQSVQADLIRRALRSEQTLEVSFQPINPRLPPIFSAIQRVKYVRTLPNYLLYCHQLYRALRNCDIVHVFSASYLSFLLAPTPAIYFARYLKKPVILNYHSGEAEDHLNRWPSAIRTLRIADRIVVPSGYLVDVFNRFGLHAQIVNNAVDLDAFSYRVRHAPRPVFLVNRSFEAHYNVACVLRAFSIIQRHIPDATLTIAGDGPLRADLHELARSLNLVNTRFIGRVQPDRMPEIYDMHDIWLNASDVDNMPMSILEAYASGLGVVTTNSGGIPYIVKNDQTGKVVNRGECASLAGAALELIEKPGLFMELTRNAQAECSKYTRQAAKREWMKLYSEVAAKKAQNS